MRIFITLIFSAQLLLAQEAKPTVAILDFEGQDVSESEVKTLSERMRTEIGNTNAVRLIERKAVEKIMHYLGLQQSGCTTDECVAEVGQLLGVQFMIFGSIGKMGKSYTIDCKMFSVATGAAESMKSITYQGEVDGLIIEIEILAWQILGLTPPKSLIQKKRRGMTGLAANTPLPKTKGGAILRSIIVPGLGQIYGNYNKAGWAYLGTELLCVGLTATSINNYNAAQTEYNIALNNYRNAKTTENIAKYKRESTTAITSMDGANKMSLTFSVLAGLVWGASVIHSAMVAPNDLGYDINKNVILAYDPKTQSTQLSFSFPI